jgi:hypothetical protein
MIGPAGNEVWSTGEWSFTLQGKSGGPIQLKGYWGLPWGTVSQPVLA